MVIMTLLGLFQSVSSSHVQSSQVQSRPSWHLILAETADLFFHRQQELELEPQFPPGCFRTLGGDARNWKIPDEIEMVVSWEAKNPTSFSGFFGEVQEGTLFFKTIARNKQE